MSLIDPLLSLQEVDTKIAAFKKEIAELPKRRATEEQRLNDLLKKQLSLEMTEATDGNDAAKATVSDEIAETRAFIAEIDERLTAVNGSLEEAIASRSAVAAQVPPEDLRFYERLAISHHPTIVKLEGNVCSGCHLTQPPSVAHEIKHNAKLVTCGMCGRILY